MNEVIDRARKDGRKKYLALIDIEKAYDRLNRRMLCKVLERIGMSERVIRIISSMYGNSSAKFSMVELETGWMNSKRGVIWFFPEQTNVECPFSFICKLRS